MIYQVLLILHVFKFLNSPSFTSQFAYKNLIGNDGTWEISIADMKVVSIPAGDRAALRVMTGLQVSLLGTRNPLPHSPLRLFVLF